MATYQCMPARGWISALLLAGGSLMPKAAIGQQHADSVGPAAPEKPPWRDSVRYGSGPSVGAPPSDFTGERPPRRWCLQPVGRAPGDFAGAGWNWMDASRSCLHDVLSDST